MPAAMSNASDDIAAILLEMPVLVEVCTEQTCSWVSLASSLDVRVAVEVLPRPHQVLVNSKIVGSGVGGGNTNNTES